MKNLLDEYRNMNPLFVQCAIICQEIDWGLFYFYSHHGLRWKGSVIGQMLLFLNKLYNYNEGNENKLYLLYSDFENQ